MSSTPGEDAPTALIKIGETGTSPRHGGSTTISWPFPHCWMKPGHLSASHHQWAGMPPPSICVGYVAGDDLGRLLRGADRDSAGFGPVIEACGRALGAFLSQSPVADLVPDPASIRADIESMAKAVMVKPWFLEASIWLVPPRGDGDFALQHQTRLWQERVDHRPAIAPRPGARASRRRLVSLQSRAAARLGHR